MFTAYTVKLSKRKFFFTVNLIVIVCMLISPISSVFAQNETALIPEETTPVPFEVTKSVTPQPFSMDTITNTPEVPQNQTPQVEVTLEPEPTISLDSTQLPEEVLQPEPASQDENQEALIQELSNQAVSLLKQQLRLEEIQHSIEVQDVAIEDSSARIDVFLKSTPVTPDGSSLEIEEVIHVFALHDGTNINAIFREPSPEFYVFADQVSSSLLPEERLEYWKSLHDQELNSAEVRSMADINAQSVLYYLPFTSGTRWPVYQDYDKHFDFGLVVGTDVLASRGGTAYVKRAASDGGGCNQNLTPAENIALYEPYNNYVRITHSDGTYAYYLHLKFGGIVVNSNNQIARGQKLGLSGNTGYSCGPHLHFNVTTTSDNSTGGGSLPYWVAVSFIEGAIPTGGNYTPYSQNSTSTPEPPPANAIDVNPKLYFQGNLQSSFGMCTNYFYPVNGAYLTVNTNVPSQSTNYGIWSANFTKPGKYKVEAYLPYHAVINWQCPSKTLSYDTSDAHYAIYTAAGTVNVSGNQKPLSDAWLNLGIFQFSAGNSDKVKLTDLNDETNTSTTISFSKMRFTLVEETCSTLQLASAPTLGGVITTSPAPNCNNGTQYSYNTNVTLTAQPEAGYRFTNWGGSASGTSSPTTVTMTGNKSVTANFAQNCYALSKTVNPTGAGTINASPTSSSGCPEGQYTNGTAVNLSVNSAEGYHFSNWSGAASGTTEETTVTITGNNSVTANFNQVCYSLSTTAIPEGGGAVSLSPLNSEGCLAGEYTNNTVVTVTASPSEGYRFSNWIGDAAGTETTTTVTMTGNKNITAAFESNCLVLTTNVEPLEGGTITATPVNTTGCLNGQYSLGTAVNLTAHPAQGYQFTGWTGDVTDTSDTTTTVTMSEGKIVTGHFDMPVYNSDWMPDEVFTGETETSVGQIRKFLQDQGSCMASQIEDSDGQLIDIPTLIHDAAVLHQINPKVLLATMQKEQSAIYQCPSASKLSWLMGAGNPSTAREQIAFAASLYRSYLDSLTANGQTISGWKVGVPKATQDGVTVIPASKAVASLFTYTPYVGEQWGGIQAGVGGNSLFKAVWDMYLFDQPLAEQTCYTVTTSSNPENGGSVNVLTTPSLDCGENQFWPDTLVQLEASSAAGYTFDSWSGDTTGTASTVSVQVDSDKSITANFNQECYSLNILKIPEGGGIVNIDTSTNCGVNGYLYGTEVALSASASQGYQFSHWGGDTSGTNLSNTVLMNGNKSVTASFDPEPVGDIPILSISQDVVGYPNGKVTMGVGFSGASNNISATTFSINYDETCLNINESDSNFDGIPDSIHFFTPTGMSSSVMVDKEDTVGELDFVISDFALPFATLADGKLLEIEFSVICTPTAGETQIASVSFGNTPEASFGNNVGTSISGQTIDGFVRIQSGTPGNVNGDSKIDAGDISALVLEIFDGDGNAAGDAAGGTFAGNPVGADPNQDTKIDAGDISCLVLIIFDGPGACTNGN